MSVANQRFRTARTLILTTAALALASGGCQSPLARDSEQELKRSVIESVQRELAQSREYPEPIRTTRDPETEGLGLNERVLPELQRMAGPGSYDPKEFPIGNDLLDRRTNVVAISLQRAIRSSVERNLSVQFARLTPAIREADVVAAEAAFDWTVFSNFNYANTDEPRTRTISSGFPSGNRSFQEQNITSVTGLRRQLTSGGQFTVQQELIYSDNQTEFGGGQEPNPANTLNVLFRFDQPLLRNFGSEVALAQVRLNRNAERDSIQQLKRELIRQVTETERIYWLLVQSHRDLLILERLLERGIQVRDQLRERQRLDATPAQIADAVARVEQRKGDLLRAQTVLRNRSDQLKVAMNHPDFPIGSETLVIPADFAPDAPITFSFFDSIQTAVANRPEVQQAILSIDDTSIRQVVADRARLPQLDLRLQSEFSALETDAGSAYESVFDGSFVDYLLGLAFEQPIGNRAAEAGYRRRRLERSQAVISYRNTIQQIVLEIKNALNNVTTNYRLIEQTRVSRLAASEVLRALLVEKETIGRYTVERLDLEFQRQEALSSAERQEVEALTNYNIALADLAAAQGTALARNGIAFVVPDADQALRGIGTGQAFDPRDLDNRPLPRAIEPPAVLAPPVEVAPGVEVAPPPVTPAANEITELPPP